MIREGQRLLYLYDLLFSSSLVTLVEELLQTISTSAIDGIQIILSLKVLYLLSTALSIFSVLETTREREDACLEKCS